MKRFLVLILSLCMALSLLAPCALAVEESTVGLIYDLTVDVGEDGEVKKGEEITVTFRILRENESGKTYKVRTLQNEILYDRHFFELVPNSIEIVKSGGNAVFQTKVNGDPVIRASYLSATGGTFQAEETFCTFRLKVIAAGGTGRISCDWDKAMAFDSEGETMAVGKSADVTVTASGPCHTFTDVAVNDWYHSAVDYVSNHGLMGGIGNNQFDPGGTMTRAMLVTVLYRMEGSPAVSAKNSFGDVKDGQWYTDAVVWANANGVVTGYNGNFDPEGAVTREQIATILYRYAQLKGYDVSQTIDLFAYTDAASISNWALTGMTWANAAGLITGRTTTTLVPQSTATRAEVATILMRFCENVAK